MVRIYFAAPLHNEEDRERNAEAVSQLREKGFEVYVPQEHGVWEDLVPRFPTVVACRQYLYRQDIFAMRRADVCVAYQQRSKGPSEGQLWEMGWFRGMNKHVVLINENSHQFNLMPLYGADEVFGTVQDAIDYLVSEEFCG